MKRYQPDEVTALFKRVFETTDGKDVLEVLKNKFERPSLMPGMSADGIGMALITQHRIAEVNMIRWIEQTINKEFSDNE